MELLEVFWSYGQGLSSTKKIWDDIYKMFFTLSVSLIAVLGNEIRTYIPINLIVLMLLLNSLIVGIRIYMEKKKYLYYQRFARILCNNMNSLSIVTYKIIRYNRSK